MGLQNKILKGVMDQQKKAMNTNVQAMEKNLFEIREAQNELAKGLISCYILLEKVAKHLELDIPEPLVKMEME